MLQSSVTSKGQMTIPIAIRHDFHIEAGDKVDIIPQKDGFFVRKKLNDITAAFGLLKTNKHATLEDMDEAIAEGIIARYERSLPRTTQPKYFVAEALVSNHLPLITFDKDLSKLPHTKLIG